MSEIDKKYLDDPKLKDYFDDLEDYKEIERIGLEIIERSAKECDVNPMQIAHRIKAPDSIAEKLIRKSDKYTSSRDLMDVVGFRVICYFSSQVDKIAEKLAENLDVDEEYSTDKRKLIEANAFGYLSLHYICTLPLSAAYPSRLSKIRFEIQIRSVLQHTWAEIEHDLGYKTEFGVPREARRDFSRIAGLLEVADLGFDRIRENLKAYNQRIENLIHSDEARDISIDLVSLKAFVKHSVVMQDINSSIAGISGAVILEAGVDSYLVKLDYFGIKTLGELKDALLREKDHMMILAEEILRDSEVEELTSTVGLYYLCRAIITWGDYDEETIYDYYSHVMNDEKRIRRKVGRIMRQREKYVGNGLG